MTQQDHSDRDHALYAPSSAKRWINCHGSIAASEGLPNTSGPWAERGTECHEAASAILLGGNREKLLAPLDDQQETIVTAYVDYVEDLIARLERKHGRRNVQVWIEERVRSPDRQLVNFHGTADVVILAGRRLYVIDLKSGWMEVSPLDKDGSLNPQLASYGGLAMDHHELWGDVDDVTLVIVQPVVYDEPQVVTVAADMLEAFLQTVTKNIKAIEKGDLSRHAGDWCTFCPAKGRCPTNRNLAVEKAKMIFDDDGELQAPRNYTAEELFEIAAEAEVMQAHIDGVRAHIQHELEKGRMRGRGWKLVPKRATSKWTDPDGLLNFLHWELGLEDGFETKPKTLTPKQLQEKIAKLPGASGKKGKAIDLSPFFVKESSGYTLARESDPREEYTPDPFKD